MSSPYDGHGLPLAFGSSKARKVQHSKFYNDGKNGDSNSFHENINNLFGKKFHFKKEPEYVLPNVSLVFSNEAWKIRYLQTLKSGLNFQKSRLNDYSIEEWSAHTAKRNPAGDVRWKLRNTINPEFLTQAWTKFYECASSFDIISENVRLSKELNSLHLCEAPGAFIASLNHFVKLRYPNFKWQWMATTLNPYYEGNSLSNMICDDRFIMHTLDNWDFGLDYTGNLMDRNNALNLVEKAMRMGEVNLMTADGSIDCMTKPDEQEETVAPLHYCEAITALLALSKGGTFIFKLFTIFEHSTINLMYLLVVCFDGVNIFKPATSKEGNSEVYAICTGYNGRHIIEPYVDVFMNYFGHQECTKKAMFPLDSLPQTFIDQLQLCSLYFYNLQCEVINNNIKTFENQNLRKENQLKKYRYAVAQMFLEKYEIRNIDKEEAVLNGFSNEEGYIHLNPRNHHGTYSERLDLIPLSRNDKISKLNEELNSLQITYNLVNDDVINWVNCKTLIDVNLSFTVGKPVERVCSSKFVLSWILKYYNKLKTDYPSVGFVDDVNSNFDDIKISVHVIFFKSQSTADTFDRWEKDKLRLIKDTLISMENGDSLILKNYSSLTQFCCGVLYILAQKSFEEIGMCNNCYFILKGFKNKEVILKIIEDILNEVDRISSLDAECCKAIVGIIPIQNIVLGDLYLSLLKYNSNFLYSYSKQFVNNLLLTK